MDVVDVVSMRIDVGVVRDRDVVADLDTAAIVKKHMSVHHDIVTES